MINTITNYLNNIGIDSPNILSIFHYGSRVYGTWHKDSDNDFIVIIDNPNDIELPTDTIKISPTIDASIYTRNQFQQLIDDHEISALECLWLPSEFVLKQSIPTPILDLLLPKLRSSLSHKASNSFVKARKKLALGEPYIGRKSMWHSFRIIHFGIQIATFGKIVNYKEANYLYEDIVLNESATEEYYKTNYTPLHNQLMTKFRKLAPK